MERDWERSRSRDRCTLRHLSSGLRWPHRGLILFAMFGTNPTIAIKLTGLLRDFISRDAGQDLVEYALVVALIAFGSVAAMKGLSTEIKTAFNVISSDLGTAL